MDAMAKYSLEADKYRSAYLPPSPLSMSMSMYSEPQAARSAYLDSTSALTKAYIESSKMYMEAHAAGKAYGADAAGLLRSTHAPYALDIGRVSSQGHPALNFVLQVNVMTSS